MMKAINVYYAVDENYVQSVAAGVRSLLDNAAAGTSYKVRILCWKLPASIRSRLERSWDVGDSTVEFIDVNDFDLSGVPVFAYFTEATYVRLLIPHLAHSFGEQRAIYLDSDTLVLSDLSGLWQMELEGHPIAAAEDPAIPYVSSKYGVVHWKELGLADDTKYFNDGVMVIDVERWRSLRLSERSFEYARRYFDTNVLLEQEALNGVVAGSWRRLPVVWNLFGHYKYGGRTEEYLQARSNPHVIHFVSGRKPWLPDPLKEPGGIPESWRFYEYLDRTEWRGIRPEGVASAAT